jgi:hypothetical protein
LEGELLASGKGRSVVFEKYPFVQDKELGIWTTPAGDKVAWFKDPDSNILSCESTHFIAIENRNSGGKR